MPVITKKLNVEWHQNPTTQVSINENISLHSNSPNLHNNNINDQDYDIDLSTDQFSLNTLELLNLQMSFLMIM